jgi:glutamyl-tRNA synthetase
MTQAPHEGGDAVPDADDEPVYTGRCRPGKPRAISFQEGANYRFRVPDGEAVRFADCNLGLQEFVAGTDFGDFLVWRRPLLGDGSDVGLPSYQLACVVDDAAMGVTEVVRGADLLKSTARQMLLQRALGLSSVTYFHTRLVRDEHGVRLAKRHDALALRTLREKGWSASEVLGYALRGL